MKKLHRMFGFAVFFSVFTIAIAGVAAPAMAQERTYAVAPVAVTGEPAPGTAGLNFVWLDPYTPYLNDSGVVALIGSPTTAGFYSDDQAVWVGSPGNLTLVLRSGDPTLASAATTFGSFYSVQLNEAGGLATQALFAETLDEGIWIQDASGLHPLAATGDPAPGTASQAFSYFWPGSFDDSGVSSFSAETSPLDVLSGAENQNGIWAGTLGLLGPVVISGDLAPGAGGRTFSGVFGPISSNADSMTFLGGGGDPTGGTEPTYGSGIWTAGPAGLSLVAFSGNEAPGTGGRSFLDFGSAASTGGGMGGDDLFPYPIFNPILNAVGDVAFGAYVDPIDPLNDFGDPGIWVKDAIGLRLIALVGDPAPGTAALPFIDFNHLDFNADGLMAFDARLDTVDTSSDHGIWLGLPDSLNLLVRAGDPAPGAAGETFGNLVMGPDLNDSGEIVFFARLRESNTDGIWAGAPGDLAMIAREGEVIEIKSGDYRTIQSILPFNGGLDGFAVDRRFNDAGQLAFSVTFTDRSESLILASPVSTSPNQPPVANAGPDLTVTENNTIAVDGSGSTDPEGTILTFVWSIGGIEVATGPKFTAGPFAPGVRTITLTVTDRSGASASDDMILTVEPNLAPVADAGADQTVNHVQAVSLDGTASSDPESGALTYVWSLNGDQIATGANPTVGPFAVSAHTITLTVTDDIGNSTLDSVVITVVNEAPVANAGPDQTVQTLEGVTLNGTGSTDAEDGLLTYVWAVGGIQVATGPTPLVGPFDAGVHAITLTVTDDHNASASDEVVVTVLNRAPTADAGADRTVNYVQTVALDGSGSADPEGGALAYAWSVGGVEIATGANPTVGPFEVGVHTVTLTVTDDKGASVSDSMVVTVINEAPVANAGPDQTANHAQAVTLAGSGSDPESGVLTYAWSIGGAQIATGANPTVGPFEVGAHTVTLTVTDDHGATASDSVVITVINEAPVANAGPDQTANHAQAVILAGSGSDPESGVLTYAWSIGGAQVATGANPTAGPFEVGVHTVTLTVTDDHGATASDSMVITVINKAPVANAGPDQLVNFKKGKNVSVTVDGSASSDPEGGALSYVWTFGGQVVGTGAIVQTDLTTGTYTFTLTVTDDHGASAADSVVVTVTKGGGA